MMVERMSGSARANDNAAVCAVEPLAEGYSTRKVMRGKYVVSITSNTPSPKAVSNFNVELGKLFFKYATE